MVSTRWNEFIQRHQGLVGRWSRARRVGRAYYRITLYLADDRGGPSFGLVCKVVGSVVIEVLLEWWGRAKIVTSLGCALSIVKTQEANAE